MADEDSDTPPLKEPKAKTPPPDPGPLGTVSERSASDPGELTTVREFARRNAPIYEAREKE